MKYKAAIVSVSFCLVVGFCLGAFRVIGGVGGNLALVPLPQKVERLKGSFTLGKNTQVLVGKAADDTGKYLAERLRKGSGLPLPIAPEPKDGKPSRNSILLTRNERDPSLGAEGYRLEVNRNQAVIRASAEAGLFYGAQTFLQLLPAEVLAARPEGEVQWEVPCVKIEDAPRFVWRGALLDVARHFFSRDELKRYIDELALHKINSLQLHLTDDQGWRLEIKNYPRLTEMGAWRKSIGFDLDPKSSKAYGPDGRYGGFYTQEEMREIIAYAKSRCINIVPEIEMPGHASAALTAHPELSCSGGPYSTDMSAGVFAGIFCPGKEETFEFLDGVLAEVSALFPGKYVHIGGDEVNKENWRGCARCQARMRDEKLKTENELQSYFVRRVEKILNQKGKRLVGWSEIRQGGLAQNATMMDWIGGAVEAATAGHDVVMSPTSHCYLDYYQSRNRTNEPRAIGAFLPLRTVYSFEPIPTGLDPRYHSRILGLQGNLWTECVASFSHVEYMTFPRVCALAEVGWSPKASRSWEDFVQRLETHTRRLELLGINYRRGFFER